MSMLNTRSNADKAATFAETVKVKTTKWSIATYQVFLTVSHVTITIILVALGDALVVAVISWLFGNPTDLPLLAQKFLEGLKILSIFGITGCYAIYLVYSLIEDVKHVAEMIRESSKAEEKEI